MYQYILVELRDEFKKILLFLFAKSHWSNSVGENVQTVLVIVWMNCKCNKCHSGMN